MKKAPSPDLKSPQSESSSLPMSTISEGGVANQVEPTKIKEDTVTMNGEVKKEKGLKRHISM